MSERKVPVRQCVGCHEMKPKKEMIRILKTISEEDPEKIEISLDISGRKNGRGAYICPRQECLNAAIKSRGLERSFKMSIPKNIYDMLTKEMEKLENR